MYNLFWKPGFLRRWRQEQGFSSYNDAKEYYSFNFLTEKSKFKVITDLQLQQIAERKQARKEWWQRRGESLKQSLKEIDRGLQQSGRDFKRQNQRQTKTNQPGSVDSFKTNFNPNPKNPWGDETHFNPNPKNPWGETSFNPPKSNFKEMKLNTNYNPFMDKRKR